MNLVSGWIYSLALIAEVNVTRSMVIMDGTHR